MGKLADLTGQTFGRMTALTRKASIDGNARWECRCACGTIKTVYAQDLKKGKVVSCGCHKAEMASKRGTHHMSMHPAYNSWKAMIARCERPGTASYADYGGRGISVCERWHDFDAFWLDMSKRWRPGLSLDRYPNQEGNYEPGNVRWATKKQQADNRSTNRIIDTPRGYMTVTQAAAAFGLKENTIFARLRYGWTDPEKLVSPVRDKTTYLRQYQPK